MRALLSSASGRRSLGAARSAQRNAGRRSGLAHALADGAVDPAGPAQRPAPGRQRLSEAEPAERPARTWPYPRQVARFPVHREWASCAVQESPVPEPHLRSLTSVACTDTAPKLIVGGGPGTGKSHLAIARGGAAIQVRKPVRCCTGVDRVTQLERDKQLGKAGAGARQLTQSDGVIRAELGDLPCAATGGAWLFHRCSQRSEQTALMITTTLSFGEWGPVFGDAKPAACPTHRSSSLPRYHH